MKSQNQAEIKGFLNIFARWRKDPEGSKTYGIRIWNTGKNIINKNPEEQYDQMDDEHQQIPVSKYIKKEWV